MLCVNRLPILTHHNTGIQSLTRRIGAETGAYVHADLQVIFAFSHSLGKKQPYPLICVNFSIIPPQNIMTTTQAMAECQTIIDVF